MLGLGLYKVFKKRVQDLFRFSLRVRDRGSWILELMSSVVTKLGTCRCYLGDRRENVNIRQDLDPDAVEHSGHETRRDPAF